MHPNHRHFLVIGAIEDADPSPFAKPAGRAPKKIMFQSLGARLLETACRMAPSLPAESIP